MKNSKILIKLPFVKVNISPYLLITAAALAISGLFSVFTLIVILCALFHELGHIFAMKLFKVKIYSLDLYLSGGVIRSDCALLNYKKELAVSFAGIFANLIFALGALIFHLFSRDIFPVFTCFCNIFLAVLNIIPQKNLDGGRILFILSHMFFENEKADGICSAAFKASSVLFILSSLAALYFSRFNLSLAALCASVILGVFAENQPSSFSSET
ncbi:MAG: hypothetical protein K6D98_03650 [Clostridiales bacterium]|nr:hypothetical protein [Clostridiales bacterium]